MKFNCTEAVTTVVGQEQGARSEELGGGNIETKEEVKPNVDGKKADSRKD